MTGEFCDIVWYFYNSLLKSKFKGFVLTNVKDNSQNLSFSTEELVRENKIVITATALPQFMVTSDAALLAAKARAASVARWVYQVHDQRQGEYLLTSERNIKWCDDTGQEQGWTFGFIKFDFCLNLSYHLEYFIV